MATVELLIAGRPYELACRDGEEDHLRALAALVDEKAGDAARAMGGLTEPRQLLLAALFLADELVDARTDASTARRAPVPPETADAVEQLAVRLEALADRLEDGGETP